MSTKTVKLNAAPLSEQISVTRIGTHEYPEPVVAVIHKAGTSYAVRIGTDVIKVRSGEVTYSTDLPAKGVARCTTDGHGPKAQRPGGLFFCRLCYRDQQKAYRARKASKSA